MMTIFPYPVGPQPLKTTSPAAAEYMGVPFGAAISMPSCLRPFRLPKLEVRVPFVGQIKIPLRGLTVGDFFFLAERKEEVERDGEEVVGTGLTRFAPGIHNCIPSLIFDASLIKFARRKISRSIS